MATSQTNTISIACNGITNVDLDTSSIQITSGQPLDSAGVAHNSSGVWAITLECGRSGSASIAENYNHLTTGAYHMFVEPTFCGNSSTSWNVPQNMNFLFKATLYFGNHGVPLYFGQDGVDLVNYWWIGGQMILNNSPDRAPISYLVSPSGSLYVVSFYGDEVDQLSISPMAI
jgi:hypothetical protein